MSGFVPWVCEVELCTSWPLVHENLLVLVIIFVPEKYKRVPYLLKNLWMRLDLIVS